jgi:hypothetical protein
MSNDRGQDEDFKGRVQPHQIRSPVRERDVQISNERWPGEGYVYNRDACDQTTEDWARETGRYNDNDHEYDIGDESGDAKGWNTYEDTYGQSVLPETRRDIELEDEVDWGDEALDAGGVAVPTGMTMSAEQTKPFVKSRTAKYWQEKGVKGENGRRSTHHPNEATQTAPDQRSKPFSGLGFDVHRKRQKDSYRPAPLEVKPTHDNGLERFSDTGIDSAPITAYGKQCTCISCM